MSGNILKIAHILSPGNHILGESILQKVKPEYVRSICTRIVILAFMQ